MDKNVILEMKDITKCYPGVRALNRVTFLARYGEVHALMGENGAGKSTLMKILSGTHPKDEGEIYFEGKKIEISSQSQALELGISMIYQEISCIPDLTIMENIYTGSRFPRKRFGIVDWKKAYQDCQALMEQLKLPYKPKDKMRNMSMADMQMLEIVKAISFDAKLIIMDEPTSALTEKEAGQLFKFIRDLKRKGITVIIITHKLDEVFEIADRVTVLRDGCFIGTNDIEDITKNEMITMMAGRDIKTIYEEKDFEMGETVLRVEHMSRNTLVSDVSFEVRRGETLGFSGIMGAGRSETMRCIFGMDPMKEGKVYLNGTEVKIRSPREAIQNGIMMVTENRKHDGLVLCRSVYENMLLPSTFKNSKKGLLDKKREYKMAEELYKQLEIKAPSMNTIANQLSGGNQQKVIIAKWLLMNPKVLILDEPTRGIDVSSKAEIYKLMRELNRQGVAIILVSSDMEELLGVSDRIVVMCQGSITGELKREEFEQKKIMEYATLIG